MTEQLHPMVPPNILLNNWESDWYAQREHADVLLIQAYQAGADAELEACLCEISFLNSSVLADRVRKERRPKPPSLKQQALQELDKVDMLWATEEFGQETLNSLDIIRRAIESIVDPS